MKVDADYGTTGVFLPKLTSKRHLLVAPTVDTVKDGMVSVVVLNLEGRREKPPARQALRTRIPTDDDMQILSLNGELERARVAEWIATLKKGDAAPPSNENKLDIGDMEAADKDLVIALLRQYADIVEKKQGCPPLTKVNVEHHINTGSTAPIMLRRRRHAVPENLLIDNTFQRLMGCVLRGLTWVCCLVYLDDVVIFTKGTVAQHVVELAVGLERLSEAGLSLKASKCSFATTKMEYLGHNLTPDGIQPTDRLIKAIVDFPRPEDDMQVRGFVALAGYYRRFVPDFGAKMSPLTSLLRKATEWMWGARQEEAFTWAKAWLSPKPVLIYPDYRLPFKLTTDASKTGLGVVLSQDQGHGDQPIAYASKVNSSTVSKCSISELECLAVVWAVRLFRPHLFGRRFMLLTGHIALKWLMTTKEPAGRLHRWSLTLQEYDFDIQYRPGKENHVADALSRGPMPAAGGRVDDAEQLDDGPVLSAQPEPETTSDSMEMNVDSAVQSVVEAAAIRRVEAAELGVVQFTDDDIKREQEKSVMVQSLLRKGAYRGQRVYRDSDGLVRAEVEGGGRIILPVVYWALTFKEAHDSIWAGLLRGPPTHSTTAQRKDWRRVRQMGIDVAGPLPVTAAGNRCVIAAVEYTTRYAVAVAVSEHTAKEIARFPMDKAVIVFGPMRETMVDGAMEFGSKATAELLELMQVKQSTPVPYRPKLLGFVERFHQIWKDIVSLYVDEGQDDWDDFLPSALYVYNSSRHSTHGYQQNELMICRKLRTPAELLRRSRLAHPHKTLQEYHEILILDLAKARELAAVALQKEQACQAMYHNQRNVRNRSEFRPGQLVWLLLSDAPARADGQRHSSRHPRRAVAAADLDSDNDDDGGTGLHDLSGDEGDPRAVATDAAVTTSRVVAPDVTPTRAVEAATEGAAQQGEQREGDQTLRMNVQRPKRRPNPDQSRGRRADHTEPTIATSERGQDADVVSVEPRRRAKRLRAALAEDSDAIAGRTRAKIRKHRRYVLEFEVQRLGEHSDAEAPERLWINQQDYEQLWSDGRVRSEQAEGKDSEDDNGTSAPIDIEGSANDGVARRTTSGETNRGRFVH
ncbi:unnamed protein product [Phytophthora fragariaefolia]|uniref:Unnamed protein product n=1 Tax=Phytophthora fragariaefolia TaxID=1490495 RepID=A0A9W6YD26_9STRA|nr:unnamed protein product [Phytophthora fragariaefolia]